jgi:hypothetical protein
LSENFSSEIKFHEIGPRFGADVTAETKFFKTSLQIASDCGHEDILDVLRNADQVPILPKVTNI